MDKTSQEGVNTNVPTYRVITTAVLVRGRLRIHGSKVHKGLAKLEQKGLIKKIVGHHGHNIYSTTP
jgi:small subunit ribosomal protein S25e